MIRPHSRSRRAFTRPDAVALMGVLGVMALLVTGAVGGRDGRRAACLDHVRQLAMASVMYAGDHGDTLPHSGWGMQTDCWAHAGQLNGQPLTSLAGTTDPTPQLPYLRAGQLWPYLRREAVFMCPQDVAERSGSLFSWWRQRDLKVTSYTMNSSLIGHGSLGRGAVHQLSRFAPDAFLLWEADETFPAYFNDAVSFPHETPSARHGPTLLPLSNRNATNNSHGCLVGRFDGSAGFIGRAEFISESGGSVQVGDRSVWIAPTKLPNRAWCAPDSRTGGYPWR